MTNAEHIYRSILLKISAIPANYLSQVDAYLLSLLQESLREKRKNRDKVMALAGGWDGMSETFFNEYLEAAKKTGGDMFQERDILL